MVLSPPLFKNHLLRPATKQEGFFAKRFLGGLSKKEPSGAVGPQSLTNAQKLSLAANTAVGTQVSVTDGFVVSGFGDARDGFYFFDVADGTRYLKSLPFKGDNSDCLAQPDDSNIWQIGNANLGFIGAASPGGTHPWDKTYPALTLTHPVLQQLTTPSSAQGGVAVLGGTQDGAWTDRGALVNGKKTFVLLGNDGSDNTIATIKWVLNLSAEPIGEANVPGFVIKDASGIAIYGSASNVATPDLATGWMIDTGDPASITVTIISQGQLVSGIQIGADTYQVNGNQNGREKYSDVLGVATDVIWDSDHTRWQHLGVGILNLGNVAFPWQGTPEVSVTADPVASESNWGPVP